jgi:hypothetical protein
MRSAKFRTGTHNKLKKENFRQLSIYLPAFKNFAQKRKIFVAIGSQRNQKQTTAVPEKDCARP